MAKKEDGTIFEGDLEEENVKPEKEEFLEPEEHKETRDEFGKKIDTGEKPADVYTEEGREELLEKGEIEPWEEAFAEGAEQKGELGTCAHCGKPLSQKESEVVEREIDHEKVWFCSDKCAAKGPKKK